jgi:hypothetical protein
VQMEVGELRHGCLNFTDWGARPLETGMVPNCASMRKNGLQSKREETMP